MGKVTQEDVDIAAEYIARLLTAITEGYDMVSKTPSGKPDERVPIQCGMCRKIIRNGDRATRLNGMWAHRWCPR